MSLLQFTFNGLRVHYGKDEMPHRGYFLQVFKPTTDTEKEDELLEDLDTRVGMSKTVSSTHSLANKMGEYGVPSSFIISMLEDSESSSLDVVFTKQLIEHIRVHILNVCFNVIYDSLYTQRIKLSSFGILNFEVQLTIVFTTDDEDLLFKVYIYEVKDGDVNPDSFFEVEARDLSTNISFLHKKLSKLLVPNV